MSSPLAYLEQKVWIGAAEIMGGKKSRGEGRVYIFPACGHLRKVAGISLSEQLQGGEDLCFIYLCNGIF